MLDFFIVFVWVEFNNQIRQKYHGLVHNCDAAIEEIVEKYPEPKYKITAVLCKRTEDWVRDHKHAPWKGVKWKP